MAVTYFIDNFIFHIFIKMPKTLWPKTAMCGLIIVRVVKSNRKVNLRSRTIFALGLIALNTLNIMDYLLTKTSLMFGAVEANILLPKDPLVVKMSLVIAGSVILYVCRHKLIARRALVLLVTSYLLVVVYQLLGIFVLTQWIV